MIENNEFFIYSVGANCVRPLEHAVNRTGELKEAPTNNNYRIGINHNFGICFLYEKSLVDRLNFDKTNGRI